MQRGDEGRPEPEGRPAQRGAWVRSGLGCAGLVVAFYALPYNEVDGGRIAVGLLLTMIAVVVLGWSIMRQVQVHLLGEAASVPAVLILLTSVVVVFASGYLALERTDPSQLVGLSTRTDALYFSLTTLTTVGYGDVHAAGQAARVLTILQLVFDVVFVTALATTLRSRLRPGASVRDRSGGPGPDQPDQPS